MRKGDLKNEKELIQGWRNERTNRYETVYIVSIFVFSCENF